MRRIWVPLPDGDRIELLELSFEPLRLPLERLVALSLFLMWTAVGVLAGDVDILPPWLRTELARLNWVSVSMESGWSSSSFFDYNWEKIWFELC